MVRKILFGGVDWDVDLNDNAAREMAAMIFRGSKIGVACSGGADSVFALYCVADIFKENLADLFVLHFNHKARAAADDDEFYVKNLCDKLNLKFVGGAPEKKPEKFSENSLREMRLKFFSDKFKELELGGIVQGHHIGDSLESSLMSLARGSGLDGLIAPRSVSRVRNTTFIRPFLSVSKTKIVEFLTSAKIPWREDESNAGLDFFRNRIRNVVIPAFESSSKFDVFYGAARSKKLLREDADFISEIFEREFEKYNDSRHPDILVLKGMLGENRALARRAVQRYIADNKLKLRSGAVDTLVEKIDSSKRAYVAVGGDCHIFYNPVFSTLSLHKRISNSSVSDYLLPLKLGKNVLPNGSSISVAKVSLTKTRKDAIKNGDNDDNVTAYIDLDSVGTLENGALIARTKLAGDAYPPLGHNSPKKVKDIFTAKKTPLMKRNSLPRVCNKKGEILWIPSLPPSNKYKIANSGVAIELTFSSRDCLISDF